LLSPDSNDEVKWHHLGDWKVKYLPDLGKVSEFEKDQGTGMCPKIKDHGKKTMSEENIVHTSSRWCWGSDDSGEMLGASKTTQTSATTIVFDDKPNNLSWFFGWHKDDLV
jgi:hypothetical protein